tara:strand:- start:317 stop:766 length:450 start_codon:yes stop_codon:yes gene_type:complete
MSVDAINNLKLVGKNKEDLKIISAYSQDSIIKVNDIVFLEKNRIFIMLINRFMWEDVEKGVFRENRRIRCALKFEEVLKVKSKKIDQNNKNKKLEFLTIECNEILDNNYEIKFFFSGDSVITLIVEAIEVTMHDLGESWIVKHAPKHKI